MAGVPLTRIGVFTREPELLLCRGGAPGRISTSPYRAASAISVSHKLFCSRSLALKHAQADLRSFRATHALESRAKPMRLAASKWWKAVVTIAAIGGFVSVYQVTMLDSKDVAKPGASQAAESGADASLPFSSHRLLQGPRDQFGRRRPRRASPRPIRRCCRSGRWWSWTRATQNMTASTPSWIPGPTCRVASSTFTCGAATRRCDSAAGRVGVKVLRLGWSPPATTEAMTLFDRLLEASSARCSGRSAPDLPRSKLTAATQP